MTRRADGRWVETATDSEGKRHFFYGHTKGEVRRKMLDFEEQEESGPRFSEVAEEWWQEKEHAVGPVTARGYKSAKNRAVGAIGDKRVKLLRPVDISRTVEKEAKSEAMSQKTANRYFSVINQIFIYAVRVGYVDSNPCRDIAAPKGLPKSEREMPTSCEVNAIKLHRNDDTFSFAVYLVLCTGIRKGELCALRWEDIDLKSGTITISKSLEWGENHPKQKLPKTNAGIRQVPIIAELRESLQNCPQSGFVVGEEFITAMHFQRSWRNYAEKTGISCTMHCLRHYFATALYNGGVSADTAQLVIGHSDIATTRKVYTHIAEEQKKKAAQSLSDLAI